MIAHLHQYIEQLDLAAEQLHRLEPAYARFSLILVDNVTELMLHRYAENEMRMDALRQRLGEGMYTDKERNAVLGQHFEEKVKFATRLSAITAEEQVFINICHRYRNQVYHKGLIHEQVIGDIAWQYHDLCCAFLQRLSNGMRCWSSSDVVSDVVRRYCGDNGLGFDSDSKLPEVMKSLQSAKPCQTRPLGEALAESAQQRLDNLDNAIEFLVRDSFEKTSRQDVIWWVQAWPFLFSDEGRATIALHSGGEVKTITDGMEVLRSYWRPPLLSDPLRRWLRRSAMLRSESSPFKALCKYQDLMDEMDDFYEKVTEAATALDDEIQFRIDEMRGK